MHNNPLVQGLFRIIKVTSAASLTLKLSKKSKFTQSLFLKYHKREFKANKFDNYSKKFTPPFIILKSP